MQKQLSTLGDKHYGSVQDGVQARLISMIVKGVIGKGDRLPSTRNLSKQLKVSRNTVVSVYEKLHSLGILYAEERKGYFVSLEYDQFIDPDNQRVSPTPITNDFVQKFVGNEDAPSKLKTIQRPNDWYNYPYPFVYSQIDDGSFPLREWKECSRLGLNSSNLDLVTSDHIYQDLPEFSEQIKRHLLPKRGILANDAEILVTIGAQNALFLIGTLLGKSNHIFCMEDPGYPDARNIFKLTGSRIRGIPVDQEGLIVDARLKDASVVFVTPSHQFPTNVTMSENRRMALLECAKKYNFLIIEDDYESETNYQSNPAPSLKSLDTDGRVIYIGSLSKSMFSGLRLGYMVGHPDLITEFRALRGAMLRHPPTTTQQNAARFIRLGYHEAVSKKVRNRNESKWRLISSLVQETLPDAKCNMDNGGTAIWVEAPKALDVKKMYDSLLDRGVVIEPGQECFIDPDAGRNTFRLGFASISRAKIKPGLEIIGEEYTRAMSGESDQT